MNDFPVIAGALRDPSRFLHAVAVARAAQAEAMIPSALFHQLKAIINRCLDEAWRSAIDGRFIYHEHADDLPRPVWEFYCDVGMAPELHTARNRLRRVAASALRHPLLSAMLALLGEAVILAALFETLQRMSVKRPARGTTSPAPPTNDAALGAVRQLLEQITIASYDALRDRRVAYLRTLLDDYLAAHESHRLQGKTLPLKAFYGNEPNDPRTYHPQAHAFIRQLPLGDGGTLAPLAAGPQASAIINQMATAEADRISRHFVDKTLVRLAGIITAKGDFRHGMVLARAVELGVLRGALRLWFDDGAAFTVQHSVVWMVSRHGRAFHRYPLTFHDVVLADGNPMARPSAARMLAVFSGK